ncbi:MAG TPA: peptidylprolyl isomerase [Roseiflexaceae bacterium]|nr:peptidylprolyl isomerase [Roseiflexaceae bacterium]
MSQPVKRSKAAPAAPRANPAGAAISAIAVIGVFLVIGLMLAGVPSAGAPTVVATPVPFAAQPTSAAVPAQTKTYAAMPPLTIDPAGRYTATISTPRGDIVVQLRPDLAPQTVNSFVFLARDGFYDGLTWHRVLPGFMAQGGDPTGTGAGGPGYNIPAEFTNEVLFDRPGLLAMARGGDPDSAGSQFFITTAPAPHLNGQYTIFGQVIQGQEIVDGIPLRNPDENPATPGEQMLRITITEG